MTADRDMARQRPATFWKRPVKLKFGKLAEALAKVSIAASLQSWPAAAMGALEILKAVGLKGNEPEVVAWLLVQRSLLLAMVKLVKETNPRLDLDLRQLGEQIDFALEKEELSLPDDFIRGANPKNLEVIGCVRDPYRRWLMAQELPSEQAENLAGRLPIYFVFALHEEWRSQSGDYSALMAQEDTPFARSRADELAWMRYLTRLQQRVHASMLGEDFGLESVYISLRGYYKKRKAKAREIGEIREKEERIAIDLYGHLRRWVDDAGQQDTIRVICGGPGSGKSSFCRMLAARLAEDETRRVLFVTLYHFGLREDFGDALRGFMEEEGLSPDILAKDNPERVLLIFDGLDELAMQGKTSARVAREFIDKVQRYVTNKNQNGVKVLVLMSGRDVVVSENQTFFCREGQILHVLPYVLPELEEEKRLYSEGRELLEDDQRQDWWRRYGKLKGKDYEGLPETLNRGKLLEITAQPLLNYLVALSYDTGDLDFSAESNLNTIYNNLLGRVYKRDWENYRHPSLGRIKEEDFIRILEEIAVACWHGGNNRTATVQQIKERCEGDKRLNEVLQAMCYDARDGVTQLLTAFYFRQSDWAGDEATFEFTHKSFGEYLLALRIVLQLEKMSQGLQITEFGWDETTCLKHWILLCGSSEVDAYLLDFLRDEIALRPVEAVKQWQLALCKLIGFVLKQGLPMQSLEPRPSFFEELRQARNAEEALLAALSSCAYRTGEISEIEWPDGRLDAFGEWLGRLRGQRSGAKNRTVLVCLNHLNLSQTRLDSNDFYGANLTDADLTRANLTFADLTDADLTDADLTRADLTFANLTFANLTRADLTFANLTRANLTDANLTRANLPDANLTGADLTGANLTGANLTGADLTGANLPDAILPESFSLQEEQQTD